MPGDLTRRPGIKAGIALFDPARMIVAGQVVFEKGVMTQAQPGKVLYGPSRRASPGSARSSVHEDLLDFSPLARRADLLEPSGTEILERRRSQCGMGGEIGEPLLDVRASALSDATMALYAPQDWSCLLTVRCPSQGASN